MSGDRRAIHDAYRATTYRAALDGVRVVIRIGERTPGLDAPLRSRGVSRWAFVTAANPHALRLPDDENARSHAELVGAVTEQRFDFVAGESLADDGIWPAEQSLLILGIPESVALALARRFAQEAIVVGEPGQIARLVFCGGGEA
ncbi:MAG: DUF3293 domain-containing protein [Myxococcota bacterium]